MRTVLLDPAVLDRVDAHASADRWRTLLNEGGWLVDGEGELRQIRTLLSTMEQADANIELSRHPIPWLTGSVPPSVWAAITGTFVILGLAGGVLVGGLVTLGLAAILSLVGLGLAASHEQKRRQIHDVSKRERQVHAEALLALMRELMAKTFLYRRPGLLLVSAPYRHQLTERLRELRASRPPVPPPGWDEEVARLTAEVERIDGLLRGNPTVEGLQP